ncbi:MAG: hypothetical protein J1F66_03235 [Clostridiales bacterium]|nr:hypothetical protein [Clostridiales bacterium]
MIGAIVAFVLAVLIGLCVFGAVIFHGRKRYNKKLFTVCVAVGAAFALVFLIVPFSIHTVDTGEVAVVKHLGEARATRAAGTHFDFWLTETYQRYDVKVQNLEVHTAAYSKDAQTMDIQMTVQYQVRADKVIDVANRYGTLSTLENRITSVSIEKTKSVLSQYSAMQIIETRAEISPEVEETVKSAIDENYFVDIVAVVLTNIDFSDKFEQTVEDKMIAEQEKLKAEYEKEKAIIEAEKELEVAKLEAEANIARAEGDAEAVRVRAEAEANALKVKSIEVARMLGFTITETEVEDGIIYAIDFTGKSAEEIQLIQDYLKYIAYLEKWDGKLPEVMGDGANIFIPLG